MRLQLTDEPRTFTVKKIEIKDFGKLFLNPGEMVSFVTPTGNECDFVAQAWGFYLGPSVNNRLKNENFKVALVVNEQNQLYVNAVEKDKIELFKKYLKTHQNNRIICWLDDWFLER